MSEASFPRPQRRLRGAAAFCALLVLAAAACTKREVLPLATPAGERANLLLVTIDTLRADHLGAWGYESARTPTLDGLARAGVRFAAVTTSAPETAPAVAGLLTGRYQNRNLVGSNLWSLPGEVPTLAERMSRAGWVSGGIVTNILVGPEYGFAQGFESLELATGAGLGASKDAAAVDAALAWIRQNQAGAAGEPGARRPWFLWLHLMDPHGPYASAPAETVGDFAMPSGAAFEREPPASSSNFGLGVVPRYQLLDGVTKLGDYVRRYDAEIAWSDRQLGRLLDGLGGETLADTLLVVTADHGESLVEHEELLQHGWFVYEPTLAVPLLMAMPDRLAANRVVEERLCTVDLLPTLAGLLGVPVHPEDVDGIDLSASVAGNTAPAAHDCYAVGPRDNRPFTVRSGDWKYIHTQAGKPGLPGEKAADGPYATAERIELYNLADDPGETRNVAAEHPEVATRLRALIDAHRLEFHRRGLIW